jgi:hypothetical protein
VEEATAGLAGWLVWRSTSKQRSALQLVWNAPVARVWPAFPHTKDAGLSLPLRPRRAMLLDEDSGRSSSAASACIAHRTLMRCGAVRLLSASLLLIKHTARVSQNTYPADLTPPHHRHALSGIDLHTKLRSATQARALWQVESSGPHPTHGTKRAAGSRDEAVALQSKSPAACGHWPWPRTRRGGRIACTVLSTATVSSL